MAEARFPALMVCLIVSVIASAYANLAVAQSSRYESPPTFSASQVLSPQLQQSPFHKIVDPVRNDGFLNVYRMSTIFGEHEVVGTELLKIRVHEAEAAVKLSEMSASGQMLKSAGRTAAKPLKTGKDLITHPGETVKGTFRGVGRFFGRVGAGMDATDPQRESLIGSLSGAGETKRRLAFQLGVDPYTQYPPLSEELARLSSAGAFGGTATSVGLAFVTGGAGIAISVGSQTGNLRELLRDKTAAELEQLGRAELSAIGVPEGTIDQFYRNKFMTPTDKTIIVGALQTLRGVQNRSSFVSRAANASSQSIAFSLRRRIVLTSAYHQKVQPISSLIDLGNVPMAQTSKGIVGIFPVDYVSWTRQFADMTRAVNTEKRSLAGGAPVQFWITGRASRRATAELKNMKWRFIENAAVRLSI